MNEIEKKKGEKINKISLPCSVSQVHGQGPRRTYRCFMVIRFKDKFYKNWSSVSYSHEDAKGALLCGKLGKLIRKYDLFDYCHTKKQSLQFFLKKLNVNPGWKYF